MASRERVELVEVAPRDGLQNEPAAVGTAEKTALIERLIAAGLRRLEVASFVHPKAVPQMADAEDVVAALSDRPDVTYIGLVLNERGFERALATRAGGARGIDEVGCVAVATDSFARRNQGQTREESLEIACRIIDRARREGMGAQITLSAAFGCPFEGEVAPETVIAMAERAAEAEPREIALADTIGVAVPARVQELIGRIREAVPHIPLRAHFHDTRNTGIANAWAAYKAGVRSLDASLGGLGGCPFAPKATGNIATEDLLYLLGRSGVETGVDLAAVIATTGWFEGVLRRDLPARVARAGMFPPQEAAPAQHRRASA